MNRKILTFATVLCTIVVCASARNVLFEDFFGVGGVVSRDELDRRMSGNNDSGQRTEYIEMFMIVPRGHGYLIDIPGVIRDRSGWVVKLPASKYSGMRGYFVSSQGRENGNGSCTYEIVLENGEHFYYTTPRDDMSRFSIYDFGTVVPYSWSMDDPVAASDGIYPNSGIDVEFKSFDGLYLSTGDYVGHERYRTLETLVDLDIDNVNVKDDIIIFALRNGIDAFKVGKDIVLHSSVDLQKGRLKTLEYFVRPSDRGDAPVIRMKLSCPYDEPYWDAICFRLDDGYEFFVDAMTSGSARERTTRIEVDPDLIDLLYFADFDVEIALDGGYIACSLDAEPDAKALLQELCELAYVVRYVT